MLMGQVTEYKTLHDVLGRGTQNLQLCIYFEETNNVVKEANGIHNVSLLMHKMTGPFYSLRSAHGLRCFVFFFSVLHHDGCLECAPPQAEYLGSWRPQHLVEEPPVHICVPICVQAYRRYGIL